MEAMRLGREQLLDSLADTLSADSVFIHECRRWSTSWDLLHSQMLECHLLPSKGHYYRFSEPTCMRKSMTKVLISQKLWRHRPMWAKRVS